MHLKIEFAQASDPGREPNKQVKEHASGFVESTSEPLIHSPANSTATGTRSISRAMMRRIHSSVLEMPSGPLNRTADPAPAARVGSWRAEVVT